MAGSAPYKATAKGSSGLHKSGAIQSPAPPSKQICPPSKLSVKGGRKIGRR